MTPETPKSEPRLFLLSQGYRNFYDRYRGDYDRFYSRDYEYNRYRDYYRQYNRDVSIPRDREGAGGRTGG